MRIFLKNISSYLGLFASMGTLICCAIPATLVMLGMGASLVGFLSEFPQLIWLSENKALVFGFSFLSLGASYWAQKQNVCPIDKREDCERTKKWSQKVFWMALVINIIGSFYAFILPQLIN